jgi:uncharacterized protein
MTGLRIASDLELDPDYIGAGAVGILAKRGAGKTYLGRVLAEEFWEAGVPFVAIDPMSAWWGLRSDADGTGPGLPVPIFGGKHGDLPLERTGGAFIADLIIEQRLSAILDLSDLGSHAAERQFMRDFLDRLYRRNSELIHLLVDEADMFAPQRPQPGDQPLLGTMENIVRRGRPHGIGCTLITQRPAVLNKNVLSQVDGLVAMRITGVNDRKAIDDWVSGHAEPDAAADVKQTLASLQTGEGWVWIPELDVLQQVKVRRLATFDSSATRTRDPERATPRTLADIDLTAIRERMAATIERAKADDPKELRAEIRRLRTELGERPTEQVEREVRVEVSVLTDEDFERLGKLLEQFNELTDEWAFSVGQLGKRLAEVRAPAPTPPQARQPVAAKPPPVARPQPTAETVDGGFRPSPAQQRVLDALAGLAAINVPNPSKTQLALFAQASPKSSGYTNNLGALRSAGLIDYPAAGTAALTPAGRDLAHADAPRGVDELHAYVRALVGPSRARILNELIATYPDALPKDELALRVGVSAKSSGYTNNLGSLRSLGLIDYPEAGVAVALPVLFLDGAA